MVNMKLRVYLAGWHKDLEYRIEVKKYCDGRLDLVNPMENTYKEVLEQIGENCSDIYIVRHDKMLIDACHILVANIRNGPTFGTVMEIQYAYNKGIPVFIIDPTPGFKYANDPWCKFHTTKLFSSTEECFDFIMTKK
jgi:nucleoside 2-deoxyribosyltransferase